MTAILHNTTMIRQTSRPPTARGTLPMYIGFLLSEPNSATCTRLAEVMEMSHDSVNRFLSREAYEPHDLFTEASRQLNLDEVLDWGLEPAFATGDSWYSCVNNLKTVKNNRMGFLFAVESNRLVSVEKGQWGQVSKLAIPDDGLVVWLRQFGEVKLFRTWLRTCSRSVLGYWIC